MPGLVFSAIFFFFNSQSMIWEELGEVNSHNCNYFPKVLRYSRSAELIPSVPGGKGDVHSC